MSDKILNPEGYGLKIYNRFPPRYREDDEQTDYSLKRYLDALGDGGFKYNIEEFNGILEFANPDMATPQALPVLYQQYGLDIFYGIPEPFLRYLLPRLGEAWSKKGSLDVVQFVVSSLTGIKTETEVVNNEDGTTELYVRLEMDYAMSDYFPDAKQFLRILDKFIPFYLGRHIIYSYYFSEEQEIHGDDTDWIDHIVHTLDERGGIVYSGFRLINTTNNPDKLVNSTFVTNDFEQYAPIPDEFVDILHYFYNETARIDPEWSHDYFNYSRWNVSHTNRDFITNRPMRTDEFEDTIALTHTDTATLKGGDTRKDHLVIGAKVNYLPMTNTFFRTNEGFVTNKSDVEAGCLKALDEVTDTAKITTTYNEGAVLATVIPCLVTNVMSCRVNHCAASVPDCFDIINHKDGSKEYFFPYI